MALNGELNGGFRRLENLLRTHKFYENLYGEYLPLNIAMRYIYDISICYDISKFKDRKRVGKIVFSNLDFIILGGKKVVNRKVVAKKTRKAIIIVKNMPVDMEIK